MGNSLLAHHGGPEGIIDTEVEKIPACLFVVYPYEVGESSGDALLPGFWKPFWNLPLTIILGLLIPAIASFFLGILFSEAECVVFILRFLPKQLRSLRG